MTISTPTYKQIIDRVRSDVSSNLPGLDPTIDQSFIKTFVDSLAGRSYDNIKLFEQLMMLMFPTTANGEYLEIWANYEGITRLPSTIATGPVIFTGLGTVPAGTEVTSSDGYIYTTDSEVTLTTQSISITTLTRSGSIVTATTTSDHNLASNIDVIISGANETEYNGTYEITVISDTQFTYTITGTPSTPATGTILLGYDGGNVNISSSDTGTEQNIEAGGKLTLTTVISGVDSNLYVTYSEVSGAVDTETDADLLVRVLQSRSNPVANFNIAAIEKKTRSVSGVTRVKVKPITPEIGDVTILFVRDNEDNIIPTATDVQNVKDALLEIKPANTGDSSVIVTAPTPVTTNYTFSAISPNTETMKTAITNSLIAFYEDSVTFETDITEDKYRSAIINTIDSETGEELESFTLTTPSGDIAITTDEIGVLGNITFS